MQEQKIYILLTDTGSLFTRLIKLYTKKRYNHASISFDSNLSKVYSFGRKHIRNPFRGGFVLENLAQHFFQRADCALYSITVTEMQQQKMERYIQEIEKQQERYRYNFIGLFGFLIQKPINRENAFFCSQFVATMLQECGIVKFNKPLSLITPYDLQEISKLNLEYEGKLNAYHTKDKAEGWHVPIPCLSVES